MPSSKHNIGVLTYQGIPFKADKKLFLFGLTTFFALVCGMCAETSTRLVGEFQTIGSANAVAVRNNFAYVVDGINLDIITIEGGSTPTLAGRLPIPYSISVAVNDFYCYVISEPTHLNAVLSVVSIANPASPMIVATLPHTNYGLWVAADNQQVMISDQFNVIRLRPDSSFFGFSTNDAELQIYTTSKPVLANGLSFFVSHSSFRGGPLAQDLLAMAVPSEERARSIGRTSVFTSQERNAYYATKDMALENGLVFIAVDVNPEGTGGYLQAFDVTDPTNPHPVSYLTITPGTVGMAVVDRLAFISSGKDGLRTVDFSDLAHPKVIATNSAFSAYGITRQQSRLYLAGGTNGLIVLDLRDAPVIRPLPIKEGRPLEITVSATSGSVIRIDRSSDLIQWTPWQTVTLGEGPTLLTDPIISDKTTRFYRAIEP